MIKVELMAGGQPLISLTVTLYVPADKPVKTPVLLLAPPVIVYVNGAVPPEATIVTVPSTSPKQLISVYDSLSIVIAAGSIITKVELIAGGQPLISLTVTLYVPADKPVKTPVLLLAPPVIV